jgi:N-acetylmuramoyl-L-alanine amidase
METPSSPNPSFSRRTGISTLRILQTTLSVAIVLATVFTGLPPRVLSTNWSGRLNVLLTPEAPSSAIATGSNQPLHIGIVSGHWGNDSGAVCPDGTTEAQVNLNIATLVQQKLTALGYDVDLLQEFDPRLAGYTATLLISIHNDSCDYVNEEATGFKVAASTYNRDTNLTTRLTACMTDRYSSVTGLLFHPGSVTIDMQDYYAFREVDLSTNAVIIETGFLNKDFTILTQQPGLIADGIVASIVCFANYENVVPTLTPSP